MNIAFIAHANKKILMENLCIAYRHILNKHSLFATEITGLLIEEVTGLKVYKYLAENLGGEEQLASQITNNFIDLVIFLKNPDEYELTNTSNSILSSCDLHNIPLATNIATAEPLLLALDRGDLDWRNILKETD